MRGRVPQRPLHGAAAVVAMLCAAAALGSCATAPDGALRQYGGMREVMRDGHVEPRVHLADLDLKASTIAVGAIEGLAGEITIAGTDVHLAFAADGRYRAERLAGTHAATLLTVATPVATVLRTCAQPLDDAALEHLVRAAGIDRVAALDVDGHVESLELHVARGACPHGETTPATEPWRWSAKAGSHVRLVGFFAPNAEGVITHHGTSLHLHAIAGDEAETITGHVDAFRLLPGATVAIGRVPR